jgi:hypothetical protein
VAHTVRSQSLFSLASENDWFILQDMTEKTAGNLDNSQLVLSLDAEAGQHDDVYVVHYSLEDVGMLAVGVCLEEHPTEALQTLKRPRMKLAGCYRPVPQLVCSQQFA